MDVVTLAIAKSYVDATLQGAGALKGEKGNDGASVTNMAIDTNGNLICTMSDGNSVNAGQIPVVTSEVETLVDERVEEKVTEQIETQLDTTIQDKVDQAIEEALGGTGDSSEIEDEIDSWF